MFKKVNDVKHLGNEGVEFLINYTMDCVLLCVCVCVKYGSVYVYVYLASMFYKKQLLCDQ